MSNFSYDGIYGSSFEYIPKRFEDSVIIHEPVDSFDPESVRWVLERAEIIKERHREGLRRKGIRIEDLAKDND